MIGDDYDAIAETVTRLSRQHDLVFTSGGIGKSSFILFAHINAV